MGKIGMLTGGGDCPGLNPVIRAVVKKADNEGRACIGFLDGWKGIVEGLARDLTVAETRDIINHGGTILGSSRTNPYKKDADKGSVEKIRQNFKKFDLDGLIAIGGDDTLGVASRLWNEVKLPVVGVPKTIDNDLSCTDFTFGFDTAVNIAMEAIDRIQTTAMSHHRVLVVETMGRHAGWIAAYAGMASNADAILVPEKPVDIDELCTILTRNRERGRTFNLVVTSEGAVLKKDELVTQEAALDDFGHVRLGGLGEALARLIEKRTGFEARHVVLGHLQRGGAPTAFDRILGTRFGVAAAELVLNKKFGQMVALRGNKIVSFPIADAVGETKTLDLDIFSVAEEFFK